MLKLSQNPIKTLKSIPNGSDNASTWLLLQGGFIRQEIAWAYTFLPMWYKVLRKIENIVREEMENLWALEMLMPALWSKAHWEQTWRWDSIDVLFKLDWHSWTQYALNPTHEDIISPLISEFIQSYKDVDFGIFQIQNKFRNEARAKSGILRGREFLMKDLYSFSRDIESFKVYYNKVWEAYKKIFDRLWIWDKTYYTVADWWDFTELNSHEFQTITEIWEDTIYINKESWIAYNEEVVTPWFKCEKSWTDNFEVKKSCEVWNIFPLEYRFSDAVWMSYTDKEGKENWVYMWSYGVWISRVMWVIAEVCMDEKWLCWPENIAPFDIYMIVMPWAEDDALILAEKFENEGKSVLFDDRTDRSSSFWRKAWDADLLWIPTRIVVSKKTLELWGYEVKKRSGDDTEILPL